VFDFFLVLIAAVTYVRRLRRRNMLHLPVMTAGSSLNLHPLEQVSSEQELSTLHSVEQLYGQVGVQELTASGSCESVSSTTDNLSA